MRPPTDSLLRQTSEHPTVHLSRPSPPGCSKPNRDRCSSPPVRAATGDAESPVAPAGNLDVRQTDLAGDPLRSTDPAGFVRSSWDSSCAAVLVWIFVKGYSPISVARVDHERRPQAHRRHVLHAGAGHAAPGLHRCPDDALTTGPGLPRSRLSAARALRPDLLRPRHHHDLLRGHAVCHRPDEFCRAAAARRARRGLSNPELRRASG